MVTVELTLDQLIRAVQRLAPLERLKLIQAVLKENEGAIDQRFDEALVEIYSANPGLDEERVMEEVNQLVHEIRAERGAQSPH